MNRNVPYSKQTLESPNPIARYAHRKRYELSVGKAVKLLGKNASLLDYGCGKGDFLQRISNLRKDAHLYGFDPESDHIPNGYHKVNNTDDIRSQTIDVFCCFETLEHLNKEERKMLYAEANRMLTGGGIIIISVPIIGGPTLLLKEVNRMILFKRISDYSLRELLLAVFLCIPAEKPENPRTTHKGFDFRQLEMELTRHFHLIDKSYSPFLLLPWYLNSQVFYVFSKFGTG